MKIEIILPKNGIKGLLHSRIMCGKGRFREKRRKKSLLAVNCVAKLYFIWSFALTFCRHSHIKHLISSSTTQKWLRQKSNWLLPFAQYRIRIRNCWHRKWKENIFPARVTWALHSLGFWQMNERRKRERCRLSKERKVNCKWGCCALTSCTMKPTNIHNKFIITFDSLRCTTVHNQSNAHRVRLLNFRIFVKQQSETKCQIKIPNGKAEYTCLELTSHLYIKKNKGRRLQLHNAHISNSVAARRRHRRCCWSAFLSMDCYLDAEGEEAAECYTLCRR